jgi:hypothetical protein
MKNLLFIALLLPLLPFSATAQETGSGMDFLNIGPSSRLLSISEAGTAVLTGPSAIYTNPALLGFEESSSIDLSYTLWISNVNNQFAAANFSGRNLAVGLGVYASRADEFEARDQPGPPAGTFSVSYLSISGALAYRVGSYSVGITAQYLNEEVFQLVANGYAFSFGAAAEFLDSRVRAGVAVRNIGEMEELDLIATPVPATFNAGLSAAVVEFVTPGLNDLPILISLHTDWSIPLEDAPTSDFLERDPDDGFISIALSAELGDLFSLQSGYRFGPTERPFSLGLGFLIEPIRVNYALVPFSTGFGVVHSFGVQYFF